MIDPTLAGIEAETARSCKDVKDIAARAKSMDQSILQNLPLCTCRRRTWWGRRVEGHTDLCRAREAFEVDLRMAILKAEDVLRCPDDPFELRPLVDALVQALTEMRTSQVEYYRLMR